jgi:hypothetical protein
VRPSPTPWVETFVSRLVFIAPEWELFAAACVSASGLHLAESLVFEFVFASKISIPRLSGDRFGWSLGARAGILVPCLCVLIGGGLSLIMLNERGNILNALREKPLKVYEIALPKIPYPGVGLGRGLRRRSQPQLRFFEPSIVRDVGTGLKLFPTKAE